MTNKTAAEVIQRLLNSFKTGTDTNGANEAARAFLARSAHPPAEPAAPSDAQCDAIHFGLSEWAKDIDARMGLPRPDSKSRAIIRAAAAGSMS